MITKLESLKSSFLTTMEFGQLLKRHLNDLSTIDRELLTDQPYNDYVRQITDKLALYEKGLGRMRKNEETEKVGRADKVRNKAVVAFSLKLKLCDLSDDPAEVESGRIIGILYKSFKNPISLNYEAESIAIDKLVSELESANYADKVALLNIGRYVLRMKVTNQNFKSLFSGRMVTEAMTVNYDMRAMRSEMLLIYNEFTTYILAMSKALNTPLFIITLSLLNTARKYYADLLARRKTVKPDQEQPSA